MTAQRHYEKLESESQTIINRLTTIARRISWLRVVIFVATIGVLYTLWHDTMACWIVALIGITTFVAVARYHDRILHQRDIQEARRNFAQARLRVLNGDLSQQPQGEIHIDPMHPFSYDLDLFGRGSLYSMLDSTSTPMGADYLAQWLKSPLLNDAEIIDRQHAIAELSSKHELRSGFHAIGKTIKAENQAKNASTDGETPSFSMPIALKIYSKVAGILFTAVVVMAIMDLIPGMSVLWLFIGNLFVAGLTKRRIDTIHAWLCSTVEELTTRASLFRHIESAQFESAMMQKQQRRFSHAGTSATHLINKLSRHLKSLDQRYNVVGYMLFNGTCQWDILTVGHINKWMKAHGECLEQWRKTLGEVDALCALATYAFENPDYSYPTIDCDHHIIMKAEQMGHQLIARSRRVNNPLPQMGGHSFLIITGANMAGKSTYLRTIGINYLLAMIGAPVAAKSMIFTPTHLFTGLRATDSLADGESYFFAELKRLQTVVKEASSGRPMFILLDEILRGTNSADKQRGSIALVKRLINLPVAGILATHDLALGDLAQEFPENISAYCFEAEIKDDTLTFDYTLHTGVAHNLNAFFLMGKMGIV